MVLAFCGCCVVVPIRCDLLVGRTISFIVFYANVVNGRHAAFQAVSAGSNPAIRNVYFWDII